MRSPISQPPASLTIFTNYREQSVLSAAGPPSSQRGSATPMAQYYESMHPQREDIFEVPDTELYSDTATLLLRSQLHTATYPQQFPSQVPLVRDQAPPREVFPKRVAEDVYRICLKATQEYIGDFQRSVELERHRCSPVVAWHSLSTYALTPQTLSKEDVLFEFVSQLAQVKGSFENHVKTVCDILWAQELQHQRLGRDTVSVMSRVMDAADSIMQAQSQSNEESRDWTIGVLRNGMDFCRYLRKFESRDEVKRIGDEKLGSDWDGIRGFNEVFR